MNNFALSALKPLLILLGLGSLVVQLLLVPVAAYSIYVDVPDHVAGILYGVAGVLAVACCQVALVAMWKLLTLVRRDDIFAPDSFRWIDLIIRMGWIATGICAVVTAYQFTFATFGPVTVPVAIAGSVVAALSVTLLMLVMRQLLESAMSYKAELAGVV